MKKTYYKNLNSKQQTIAIEKLLRATNEAGETFKNWEKYLEDEKQDPMSSKETIEVTEDLLGRYKIRYCTLLETLDLMGISRYDI